MVCVAYYFQQVMRLNKRALHVPLLQDAVILSEAEVMEKFVSIEAHKQKLIDRKLRAEKRKERKIQAEMLAQHMAESKMQRKLEQQGVLYTNDQSQT